MSTDSAALSSEINFIVSGEYMSAIQNLLSNSNGSGSSVSVENRPGSVNPPNTQGGISGKRTADSVTISLSPEAQRSLSMEKIALDLISPASQSAQPSSQNDNSASQNQEKPTQPSFSTGAVSSQQGDLPPTQSSVAGILAVAEQTIVADPAAVFYAAVMAQGGPAQFISYNSNAALQKSFVEAFNNGSLTIQSSAQTPQLGWISEFTATGTGGTEIMGWNTNTVAQLDAASGTYSTGLYAAGLGGVYVTWPNSSTPPSASTNASASG